MGKLMVASVKNTKPGRRGDGDRAIPARQADRIAVLAAARQVDGVRRDIRLGAVDTAKREHADTPIHIPILQRKILTLAEARDKCDILCKAALAGLNVIAERDKGCRSIPTFEEAAIACHADLKANWSQRQADSFLSSLKQHAFPKLGKLRVDQIEGRDIRDMLAPILIDLADMSRKVRARTATVLNYAYSKGWRDAEAPSKSVTMGLGRKAAGGNYAAMPYADVPAFVATQSDKADTVGRLALMLTIHTAARSGEVRHARWLSDFVEAGRIKAYADVVETLVADDNPMLGGRIPVALWRRIVAEGKIGEVWVSGRTRLEGTA